MYYLVGSGCTEWPLSPSSGETAQIVWSPSGRVCLLECANHHSSPFPFCYSAAQSQCSMYMSQGLS